MDFTIPEIDFIVKELNERIKHHRQHYYKIYDQDQEDKIAIIEKFQKALRAYGYNMIRRSICNQMPDEAHELDRLLKAICSQHEDELGSFEIHINKEVITLTLGGPQMEGLFRLIEQIADENFYLVDYNNHEVKGWRTISTN